MSSVDFKPWTVYCAVQLSEITATFMFWFEKFRSHLLNVLFCMSFLIHTFFFMSIVREEKQFAIFIYWGFSKFPITKGINLADPLHLTIRWTILYFSFFTKICHLQIIWEAWFGYLRSKNVFESFLGYEASFCDRCF